MKYKHLFFDLDLTLWDFEKNSAETLNELFEELKITEKYDLPLNTFLPVYKSYNEKLWDLYRKEKVSKEQLRIERFNMTFQHFGIEDKKMLEVLSEEYVSRGPYKNHLLPFAKETLQYLSEKYTLHIITNGFEEVQHVKLNNSDIRAYFKNVITSELAGYKKPDPRIFHYSLYRAKAKSKQSIMVGDHFEIDILGAKNAGIDQIYFNPSGLSQKQRATYEINCLSRLMEIF